MSKFGFLTLAADFRIGKLVADVGFWILIAGFIFLDTSGRFRH